MKRTETKSVLLLQHHLKALKLPTILAECQKIASRCAKDNVDHLGFLLQLCELELIDREKRAAERRLKAARFPTYKTLDNFDFAAQPSVNKTLVGELLRCLWIEQRENVLLVGNRGYRQNASRDRLGRRSLRPWQTRPLLPGEDLKQLGPGNDVVADVPETVRGVGQCARTEAR